MIKNILISGGAGFIGSNLALKLVEKNYCVTVLDNLSVQVHGEKSKESFLYNQIRSKVNFIIGDVRNREDWEKALTGQDAVIHFAAETGTGQSMYEIYKYSDTNINGSALLLDILATKKDKIEKVIIASSRAIYGEGTYCCPIHGEVYPLPRKNEEMKNGYFECRCPHCLGEIKLLPTHEESKIVPHSIYGISKYTQEQLFLTACKFLNIPVVAFRYQNVYGPGQSLSNPYTGILSIFSTQIKNNNSINIFEDGKESRDFIYIDDVTGATILGLENDNANYNYYNVGSGVSTNVLQGAEELVRLYNSNVKIQITGKFRIGDIRHNYADLNKIKNDLNFEPQMSFDKGMENFVKWVNTQETSKDRYSNTISELEKKGLYK